MLTEDSMNDHSEPEGRAAERSEASEEFDRTKSQLRILPIRQLDLSAIHSEHAITELSSTIGPGPEIAEHIQATLKIIRIE